MIGVLLVLLFGVLLTVIVRIGDRKQGLSMLGIVLGGYVLRLIIQIFIRDVQLFSHDIGGDAVGYEQVGVEIARLWRVVGVSFFTDQERPGMGATVLPQNLFAAVVYLNGGEPSRLGCTAIVAFAAGLTAFNLYHLAVQFGANPVTARRTVSLFYLGPTFLHYTADTFKDGLVVCFTVGALGSAIRLMQRVSLLHVTIGVLSLLALWYVRFYLIFVTMTPLIVGFLGMRSKSVVRPLFASLALMAVALVLLELTDIAQQVSERAAITYQAGTADVARTSNASGGSGVVFDDGGRPLGALWLKLFYTLFSPFPWGSGSMGFHIGKIDVFIIYFFVLRAWAVTRTKELRLIVLMVMTFALPCTVMYATSIANVGLIVRQRLVVIAALTFLASLYRPASERTREDEEAEATDPGLDLAAD